MTGARSHRDARAWRLSAVLLLAVTGGALARSAFTTAPGSAPLPVARIDLNTAPASRLELLRGVGPKIAGAIVADRAANGPYKSVDDLQRVPRIGPRTVRAMASDAVTGR